MNLSHSVLISAEQIDQRLTVIGNEITKAYEGQEVTLLCVLKGAFIFTADLARKINLPVTIEFIGLSSYVGTESSGKFSVTSKLSSKLKGRHVVICEDIIDTGKTIDYLYNQVIGDQAESVKLCTFLSKPKCHEINHKINFVGFEIGNEFVIGYGLDLDGRYRELPYLAELKR